MKTDLQFLREYFKVPKSAKVSWGLIEEIVSGEKPELRPGLIVSKRRSGPEKIYLDIAHRRFYTEVELMDVSRKIYPAKRLSKKNFYLWVTEDGLNVRRGKGWVKDLYYPAVYNKNFKDELLL